MKTLKFLSFFLVFLVLCTLSCSKDDDESNNSQSNNNGNNNNDPNEYVVGSMNMTNQDGKIETISFSNVVDENDPEGSSEISIIPHNAFKIPTFDRAHLQERLNIDENEPIYGVIIQRTVAESVSGPDEIFNPGDGTPSADFDGAFVLFVKHNSSSNFEANALIENSTNVSRSASSSNDYLDQVNWQLTSGKFKISVMSDNLAEGILCETNSGQNIVSLEGEVDSSAFSDDTDGNIVSSYFGNFDQALQIFNEDSEITILRTIQALDGVRKIYTHPIVQ